MRAPSPNVPAAGQSTPIHQDEALSHLARLETPRVPIFYESGIVEAGRGYYQLATFPDDERVLIYALNLKDLQLKEYPGIGQLYAQPERLFGVNAYGPSASPNEIYTDLVDHQSGVMRLMREEYTLVRTEKDVYRSRAVSYALKRNNLSADGNTPAREEVSVDVFINPLHDTNYAPTPGKGNFYEKISVSRVPLRAAPIEPKKVVPHLLNHYMGQLNKFTRGEDGLLSEAPELTGWKLAGMRMKIYGMRLADNLAHAFRKTVDEIREKQPSTIVELANRAVAAFKILTLLPKGGIELAIAAYEAFSFSPHLSEQKIPEALKPYLSQGRTPTRLNSYLRQLEPAAIEMAAPMTMAEANIVPQNAMVYAGSPFEAASHRVPDLGTVRAPLGAILHRYPTMSLMMQANGIWMAMRHADEKIYVGYNRDIDTKGKPYPSPVLNAWLDNEKVICYTREGHGHTGAVMEWKHAARDLQEIIRHGDGHLLATHAPRHDPGPHVIPARTPPDMRYLDFSEALKEHGKRVNPPESLEEPGAPDEPRHKNHPGRRQHRRHGVRTPVTLAA